jgi:peptidoglycan/xylan/chitin deacetylase (PgdA/CDA1 family)
MSLQLIDNPPPWPNGARCAVCFSFDLDAESLIHLYYPEDAGRRVTASSALRYGPRIAVPRLIKIWRHYNMRQTLYVPGWCIENYPAVMASLVEAGHEIGHHGYLHERPNQLTRDDEARVMARGIDCIEKLTGARPKGYRCPSGAFSAHTLDLLLEHGFAYDASLHGDDVPYLIENDAGRLVELPSDYPLDDWPQYVHMKDFNMAQTIQSPQRAMEVFQAEFDAAWTHGGLWAAIWHPFVSGRLARADAMVRLIEHMIGRGQVWFAPMAEIAAHVQDLIDRGEWTPRSEKLPYWTAPVPQVARPKP